MKRLQFCLAVFAVLALTLSALAQVQNGQFTGTVTDPTGAAIANAKVTVTNPETQLSLTTTTNSSGNYTVKEVPIGVYKLTVEATGFKTVANSGVQINAGTISHVDFKLQVGGGRGEIVEVTGATPQWFRPKVDTRRLPQYMRMARPPPRTRRPGRYRSARMRRADPSWRSHKIYPPGRAGRW